MVTEITFSIVVTNTLANGSAGTNKQQHWFHPVLLPLFLVSTNSGKQKLDTWWWAGMGEKVYLRFFRLNIYSYNTLITIEQESGKLRLSQVFPDIWDLWVCWQTNKQLYTSALVSVLMLRLTAVDTSRWQCCVMGTQQHLAFVHLMLYSFEFVI